MVGMPKMQEQFSAMTGVVGMPKMQEQFSAMTGVVGMPAHWVLFRQLLAPMLKFAHRGGTAGS